MNKPRLIVFASGTRDGGGSGFKSLVIASRTGILNADIVAVVSNHQNGGVKQKRDELSESGKFPPIDFVHSPFPRTAAEYRGIALDIYKADFIALSGWLGIVEGLPSDRTINIHPALIPSRYCGKGWHGNHIHKAVLEDFERDPTTETGVSMHFVTDKVDSEDGLFFRKKVPIIKGDTLETLRVRVNAVEHEWQATMTNLVVTGKIGWDGKDPASMRGALIDI